ncbi:MAG: hypothetical protein RL653_1251 [Pseudomonadota bacterium]|jgi:hypothetical protein
MAGPALAAEQESVAWGQCAAEVPAEFSRGLTFGLSLAPFTRGDLMAALSAEMPLYRLRTGCWPVALSVRGTVAELIDFSAPPVASVSAVVRLESGHVQPYLGTGVGLAWLKAGQKVSPLAEWGVLAGLRIPIDGRWGARVELTGSPVYNAYAGAVGVEFSL